jgi:hypothetical protein
MCERVQRTSRDPGRYPPCSVALLWELRQGEVAKLAGISATQRSQIETGKRPGVQAVTMAKIAQVLHVSTDYL